MVDFVQSDTARNYKVNIDSCVLVMIETPSKRTGTFCSLGPLTKVSLCSSI